jgi:hypothetical protein
MAYQRYYLEFRPSIRSISQGPLRKGFRASSMSEAGFKGIGSGVLQRHEKVTEKCCIFVRYFFKMVLLS